MRHETLESTMFNVKYVIIFFEKLGITTVVLSVVLYLGGFNGPALRSLKLCLVFWGLALLVYLYDGRPAKPHVLTRDNHETLE